MLYFPHHNKTTQLKHQILKYSKPNYSNKLGTTSRSYGVIAPSPFIFDLKAHSNMNSVSFQSFSGVFHVEVKNVQKPDSPIQFRKTESSNKSCE